MNEKAARVWEMMEAIDFCMLVVQDKDGLASRPMSTIPKRDEDCIYFLSNGDSEHLKALEHEPSVLLAYGDGGKAFVSVRTNATVSRDNSLIKHLWNPGAQAFWPAGPEASDVAVIKAEPEGAEYWDGSNGLVSAVKMVFALATRSTAHLGDNAKVDL